ncbi:30S ribosomal protein S11, chloroplastic [Cichlidogyrus casuarinus]|uniref:Small ribosomal subunit protein uS17 n=1 Tax=Cichlidogyrus casuarinus TaxID=1844966 RepID=A0ABD2QPE5_9PLAT
MADQDQKAFQKQEVKGKNGGRYYKSIGLGYKTPKDAIYGKYIDKKCPFTSGVTIRGRILSGIVKKMKMNRTIVVRRDYFKFVKKYKRYERRHKNISVHLSPCFRDCAVGDLVTIGQCRPLSKTVSFNVIKIVKGTACSQKKAFAKF